MSTVWESGANDGANILRDNMELSRIKSRHCRDLCQSLTLPDGWDGDGGQAPIKQDVDNAVNFLDHIPRRGIMLARVMIAGDGDVGFDWGKSGRCLEVGFSDGEISFYGKTPGGERLKGTEVFKKGVVPAKLQSLLDANFSG